MKGALKIFAKFHGLDPCKFFKRRPQNICFPINFVKFLRKHFYRKPGMFPENHFFLSQFQMQNLEVTVRSCSKKWCS